MNDTMITEGPVYMNNTGWICPKCGLVISPDVKVCPHCSGEQISINIEPNSYTSVTRDVNNLQNHEQMIFS